MATTNLIFDSDRFDIKWHPEGGDGTPPPGFDLAVALFKSLTENGAVSHHGLDMTMWEHGCWYFKAKTMATDLSFTLQPFDDGKTPHSWWLSVQKTKAGLLKSIFGSEDSFEPSQSIKELVEQTVSDVARASGCVWKSSGEVLESILPNKNSPGNGASVPSQV